MSAGLQLTAVYSPVEDGWVQATIAEMPGVITAAASRPEAEAQLLDALKEYPLSFAGNHLPSDDHLASDAVSSPVRVTFSTSAA